MSRLRAVLLAVLVATIVLGGTASAGAADATSETPRVHITVDSTPVSAGETYETGRNVDVTVDASVGSDAPDGTELREIVVRVNGERYETFTVNGTAVSKTVRPDLSGGDNSVRVIVTDEADNVNSTQFTVYKDGEAPHVFLNEPYQTQPWRAISDGSVNGSETTLVGEVIEDSSVEKLQVTHDYGENYTDSHVRRNVDDEFSVPLTLGRTDNDSATNRLRITATDEYDNVRIYEFEINVSDGGPPTISLEPFPNETSQNQVFFAGTIRDDVWIDHANVTVRALDIDAPDENQTRVHTLKRSREYSLDVDRRTLSFNESVYPSYRGTYAVTVNATDITGETTSRTAIIERLPYEPEDLRPEVVVDRDRTVVLDGETLFLSGVAFEGTTRRLVVETRNPDTGDTIDYQVVHDGRNRDRVAFDREVAIRDGPTTVILRATDPDGNEVTEKFTVDGASQETFVGSGRGSDDPWPAVTVLPLGDERPATATSSVTVRRASGGETVSIPAADGPDEIAGTDNVTLERLDVSLTTETNVTATVVVRQRGGQALSAPPGATPGATVSIQHSLAATDVSGVRLTLSVDQSYLDAHDLDAEELQLYRQSGEGWTGLRTRVLDRDGSSVRYRVDSPGLSVFSLAAGGSETTTPGSLFDSTGNVTAVSGPGGDWTVADGANDSDVTNDTASGQSGETDESGGQARIFVSDVTVNRTEVAVNETVSVNATLANSGNESGEYVATLETLQGLNRTFAGRQSATVPPGEERTVTFTTAFAEPGNHTVSVNGTQAGPVVVESGGGLLSIFSILPLRLIGMGLGALVGLGVVLVLVRFVLRRVGGGGEEASG